MRQHWPLLLILLAYLAVAGQYALLTPPWQAPDEPAHYNVIRQLAAGEIPVMAPGDYDEAYLNEIRDARFAPEYSIDQIEYEDWQPPLYYLLLTPIFWLFNGSLIALRFTSVLFGAGVVLLAGLIGVRLFPKRPYLGWSTAVVVAFIPQHLAMLASVNNDSLAELLIAAILFNLLPLPDEWSPARLRRLGLLMGLGFLTKATVYLMAPVIGVALLWHYRLNWQLLLRRGLQVFVPALLLGSFFWARNAIVYGGFDVMAKAAHDAVVVGQPRTATWIADFGLQETVRRFFATVFNSFWGQFGWMAVPMQGWAYQILLLLVVGAILGLGVGWFVQKDEKLELERGVIVVLGLTVLLTAGVLVGYNFTYVQHQGRYLFPALVPLALAFVVGYGRWWTLLARQPALKRFLRPELLPLGLALGFITLDLYALYRWIVPFLQVG